MRVELETTGAGIRITGEKLRMVVMKKEPA
jgi:hypothetical protein